MNVLIIDIDGCGLDFAIRCQEWGHEVKHFIRVDPNDGRSKIGTGIVPRVPHWEPHLNWSDLILVTGNDFYLHKLENLRKHYPVFAPPLEGMRLEIDREYGSAILKEHGIQTIPYECFGTYKDAEAHVRKNPARYVSKPTSDREGNAKKAMTYVSKNPADMCYMLKRWERLGKPHGPFMLQEFKKGVEFGISGWFGGGKWGHLEEHFEFKKLMNDDLGVNTGEMGSAIKYVDKSKIFDKLLKPLTEYLQEIDYRGDIAIGAIVDDDGDLWPTEFTSRLGWPDFYIRQALHMGDPVTWMVDMLEGENTLEVSSDVAIGIVLAQPDFPYSRLTGKEVTGMPIYGITPELWPNLHMSEVMAGEAPCMDGDKITDEPCLVTCGDYVMVVSGTGPTVRSASKHAYSNVKQIEIPNSIMYRTDIGDRLKEDLPELQRHGLAISWDW